MADKHPSRLTARLLGWDEKKRKSIILRGPHGAPIEKREPKKKGGSFDTQEEAEELAEEMENSELIGGAYPRREEGDKWFIAAHPADGSARFEVHSRKDWESWLDQAGQ